MKEIFSELKKTKWPTAMELVKLTVYTAILCAIIAVIITGLDLGYTWILSKFGIS